MWIVPVRLGFMTPSTGQDATIQASTRWITAKRNATGGSAAKTITPQRRLEPRTWPCPQQSPTASALREKMQ
jgi:hypothetical protein